MARINGLLSKSELAAAMAQSLATGLYWIINMTFPRRENNQFLNSKWASQTFFGLTRF